MSETDKPPRRPADQAAVWLKFVALMIIGGLGALEFFRPTPSITQLLATFAAILAVVFGPDAVRDMWPGKSSD